MKKKIWIPIAAVIGLLAILLVPIPKGTSEDGGTREYVALIYKIVHWNRLTEDGIYEKTRVYFGTDRDKSIDDLWGEEAQNIEHKFRATVLELSGTYVLVQPLVNEAELRSADQISFSSAGLEDIGAEVGSVVEVRYTGAIMESYPAQISVTGWAIWYDLRHLEYSEEWLDKTTATKYDQGLFSDIRITKIYSNCFFAKTVIPMPYEIKLNGTLSDEWCVGDQVKCTYDNVYYDEEADRIEVDFSSVEESDFELEPGVDYKPVIYLYPQEETDVSVFLTLDGKLTCTYPAYGDGWTVTASPDGTLTDENGQTYNYLYWEGETYARYDLSQGFCVKGEDTAKFLENALESLGLSRREANEFIVYWLPLMQENPYNVISFQTDIYTDAARLEVSPAPDTLIRVFMAWKRAESYVELEDQILTAPARRGFTVVEWGGTEVKH